MAEVRHSRTETAHIEVREGVDAVYLNIAKHVDVDGEALFEIDTSEFGGKPLLDVDELWAVRRVITEMLFA